MKIKILEGNPVWGVLTFGSYWDGKMAGILDLKGEVPPDMDRSRTVEAPGMVTLVAVAEVILNRINAEREVEPCLSESQCC